ncbi:hypothetical protein [Hymenobacter sp.]|jgi:hypothetical protein|uniref:exodeoxyribonuclease X C-terminal domain-containing protein n=1 Tax=Hymenobacter sp. TaxID=1898978 RepID=UPI002ED8788E
MSTALHYYFSDSKFTFGKYKGYTLREVAIKDPSYISFCCANISRFCIAKHVLNDLKSCNTSFCLNYEAVWSLMLKNSLLINCAIDLSDENRPHELKQIDYNGAEFDILAMPGYYISLIAKYVYFSSFNNLSDSVYNSFVNRVNSVLINKSYKKDITAFALLIKNNELSSMLKWINDPNSWCNTRFNSLKIDCWLNSSNEFSERKALYIETVNSEKYSGVLMLIDFSNSDYSPLRQVLLTKEKGDKYEAEHWRLPKYEFDYIVYRKNHISYPNIDPFSKKKERDLSIEESKKFLLLEKIEEDKIKEIKKHNDYIKLKYEKYKYDKGVYINAFKPFARLTMEFWWSIFLTCSETFGPQYSRDKNLNESKFNRNCDEDTYTIRLAADDISAICKTMPVDKENSLDDIINKEYDDITRNSFFLSIGKRQEVSHNHHDDSDSDPWKDSWDTMTDGQYGSYRGSNDYEGIGF